MHVKVIKESRKNQNGKPLYNSKTQTMMGPGVGQNMEP